MSKPSPLFRLFRAPAFWIWIAAFVVRHVSLTMLEATPYYLPNEKDMRFYHDWAMRVSHGQWTDGHAFYGLPGYAYFLAAIYSVTGFNPYAVGFIQAASEATIAVLIFKITVLVFEGGGSSLRAGTVLGLLAASAWILFQPAAAFSVILMPTTWLVLAFWGSVYFLMRLKRTTWWRPWLGMGALWGMVAMMIATIFFLIPLAVAKILGTVPSAKARAGAVAVLIGGLYIGTAPCWIHNYFVAREPVMLSAHSGVNFFVGNNAGANGYPKIPSILRASQEGMLRDSILVARQMAGRELSYAEVSRFWSEKAWDFVGKQPGAWLQLLGRKVRNFWSAFEYDDLSLLTLLREERVLWPGLRFGWAAALAAPGMIFAWRRFPRSRWVAAAVGLHMAALLSVFVTERYRLAAAPGLIILGVLGLYVMWDALVQGRWRIAGAFAAVAVAWTAFVAWPQKETSLYSLDNYNTGLAALNNGQWERAKTKLELAYAYVPDNAETNFAIGNLWYAHGDVFRAKSFYRAAVELNPKHAGAFNNLGVIAFEENWFDVAAKFFQRSIEAEPEDAKTHYLLARTKLGAGDPRGAAESIDGALQLDPNPPQFRELQKEIAQQLPR